MTYLGIRASAQEIRYAVIEKNDAGQITFVNQNTEHRLKYPANCSKIEDKLRWVYNELDRILRQNSGIEKAFIKMNEYGSESGSKRETTYVDAICLLVANERHIPVERKLYSQMGVRNATVKEQAEEFVGRTSQYWNTTIADAIMVAYREIRRA